MLFHHRSPDCIVISFGRSLFGHLVYSYINTYFVLLSLRNYFFSERERVPNFMERMFTVFMSYVMSEFIIILIINKKHYSYYIYIYIYVSFV